MVPSEMEREDERGSFGRRISDSDYRSSTVRDLQVEQDIAGHFVDKWLRYEITDEELEKRLDQFPLSTDEEELI